MFGVYDIRGVWGKELTPQTVLKLGNAFSEYIKDNIVGIGKDIRIHSEIIYEFLVKGLGKEIIDYGIITTPIAHFASVKDNVEVLMITASHNPKEYNGIKPIHKKAEDFSTEEIKEIEIIFNKIKEAKEYKIEKIKNRWDIINEYFEFLDSIEIPKINVSFDLGNATGFIYIPFLKRKLNLKVINDVPDGTFPNHLPDPSKPENLKDLISITDNVGFALDGDCDRLGIVYKKKILTADFIIYLFAKYYLKKNDTVVIEVMIPFIFEEILKDLGLKVIRVPTGHVNVKRYARRYDAKFFGEYSGHFGFKEFYYIDDALYTFLKFLELIHKEKINIDEELKNYPFIYQRRIDVPKEKIKNIKEKVKDLNPQEILTIDGYDLRFENGRILIRKSRTEPLYRIKIEALDKSTFEKLEKLLKEKLLK